MVRRAPLSPALPSLRRSSPAAAQARRTAAAEARGTAAAEARRTAAAQARRTAAAQAGRTAAAQAGRTAAGNVKTAVGHSRITARDVRAAASHRCTRKFADRLDGFNPQATRTVKGGVHDHAGIA